MIEPAFRILLTNAEPAKTLLADRVYLGASEQNERRGRVVITRTGTDYGRTHDNERSYTAGRVQLACLAPTYQAARELADAVGKVVDQFSTDLSESDLRASAAELIRQASTKVHLIEIEDEEDIERAPLEGKASPTFGVAVECSFLFEEQF